MIKKNCKKPHYIPIYLFIFILDIYNNLILYEVSDQPSVSAFQFHIKMISFWLNTKSKVQKIIHFSISCSQSHKIESSKV